jgi:YbbR domain-containing protein
MFKNLSIKFLSFILALALWLYVTNQGKTEISLSIPVQFANIPKGLELLSSSAEYVTLRVWGARDKIRNLSPQKIKASIDLSNSKKGESIFYLTTDIFDLPQGVSIAKITPADIKVKLEETLIREVPIKPEYTGEPPYGYKIKKIRIRPTKAKIAGPVSVAKTIHKIHTNPIDISEMTEDSVKRVSLQLPKQPLRIIQATPFYAYISIEEIFGTKDFKGIPININNSGDHVVVNPTAIKVVLKGPLAILRDLKREDLVVKLDLMKKQPGTYHLPPSVELPDRLILEKLEPRLITVKISQKQPVNKK